MKKIIGLDQNQQQLLNQGFLLPVMEEFLTLQGEGYHTGKAAWFIRIGGCDVGCHWCDVKESWNPNHFPPKSVDNIVLNAVNHNVGTVVVTGGEPLNYNLERLTAEILANDIKCHLETSGSSPLSGKWDWICLSPKRNKPPLEEFYTTANELKVIIEKDSDFEWAERIANNISSDCKLYLQPEWSKRNVMMKDIIDYILLHPQWAISLQSHKYMRIP